MPDITSVVNTILANGSTEYQSRVPVATRTNIQDVGNAILSYTPTTNEFLTLMLNKIVMQLVNNKSWSNPLAALKKGTKPLGFDIENSYTNPATAAAYDRTGANLLSTVTPDVKTEYFRLNRRDRYKVTVYPDDIRHAFTSYEAMNSLIDSITNSLYNGDFIDEFILMKNLFSDAIINQKMITASITAVTTEATAQAALVAIKNLASAMQYPSTAFNAYAKSGGAGNAVNIWTPKSDQVIVIRSDILNYIDVMVLAAVFNLEKADIKGSIVEVDNFGFASNCLAVIMDKATMHVWDDKNEAPEPFRNPEGLYYNYFWHHWQTLAMSLLTNAVAIVDDAVVPAAPVITEANAVAAQAVIDGTSVTGNLVIVQLLTAANVLRDQKQVVSAANAFSVTMDVNLALTDKIIVWQVDPAGNKSANDTFTVVA